MLTSVYIMSEYRALKIPNTNTAHGTEPEQQIKQLTDTYVFTQPLPT